MEVVGSGLTVQWLLVVFRRSGGWSRDGLVVELVLVSTFVTSNLRLLLGLGRIGRSWGNVSLLGRSGLLDKFLDWQRSGWFVFLNVVT